MRIAIQLGAKRHGFGSYAPDAVARHCTYCLMALVLASTLASVRADLTTNEQYALAMRFRPYIKTDTNQWDCDDCEIFYNLYRSDPTEPHHPCNWEWFIGNCYLVSHYQSIQCDFSWGPFGGSYGTADPQREGKWPDGTIIYLPGDMAGNNSNLLISPQLSNVRAIYWLAPFGWVYGGSIDPGFALEWGTTNSWTGEDWTDVIYNGHGIYAHVEEVPNTTLINIEYTILWAYNSAQANMHNGDLTTITCVYDKGCDLLARVTYVAHGAILQSYRTAEQWRVCQTNLSGLDENENPVCMRVAKLSISSGDAATVLTGACVGSNDLCGPNCTASDPYLYFAYDPITCRYEHPVVFAEYASHEFWPNPSGTVCTAHAHNGNGVSFLPSTVQILGTLAKPFPGQEPFLYYNGLMGTDPAGIILHRTWYWPNGLQYGLTDDRLSDASPYQTNGNLPWPPAQEFTNGPGTVYVDWQNSPGNGTASRPFADIVTAYSFVPSNGVISAANGTYTGPAVISRPCTLVSRGGTVTITGGAPSCLNSPYVTYFYPLYVMGKQMTVVSGTSPSTAIWQVSLTGLSGLQWFRVTDAGSDWRQWCQPKTTYAAWFYPDASGNVTITYDPNPYSDGWYPAQGRIGVSTDAGNWQLLYATGTNTPSGQAMHANGGGIYELDAVVQNPTTYYCYAKGGDINYAGFIGAGGFSYGMSPDEHLGFTTTVTNQEVDFFVNAYAGLIKAVVKP